MQSKIHQDLKAKEKHDDDIKWVAKYCVNPFRIVAEHANDVSLFDLHAETHIHLDDSASIANFSQKNYAIWNDQFKYNKSPKSKQNVPKPKREKTGAKSVKVDIMAEPEADLIFAEHFEDKKLLELKQLPELQRLQASLVRAFPICDDLNNITSAGFQPHLTLGQYKKRNIGQVVSNIAEQLFSEPEVFTIDSIHIITRHSVEDKFEIRATIDLPFS